MRTATLLITLLLAATATASEGRIVDARGVVERVGLDGNGVPLQRGDHVRDGDLIRVETDGQARILMDDQALIDLGGGSELRVQRPRESGSTSLSLVSGRLWARVSALFGGSTVEVETPNAVAGVRGTSFFTEVDGDATTVSVEAGAVEVASRGGDSALIGASESARVAFGRLERASLDSAGFAALRARVASRDHRGDFDRDTMEHLRGAWRRAHDRDGGGGGPLDGGRLRDALREAYRNRRDNPLDIDPPQARRIRERLRELREIRRRLAAGR